MEKREREEIAKRFLRAFVREFYFWKDFGRDEELFDSLHDYLTIEKDDGGSENSPVCSYLYAALDVLDEELNQAGMKQYKHISPFFMVYAMPVDGKDTLYCVIDSNKEMLLDHGNFKYEREPFPSAERLLLFILSKYEKFREKAEKAYGVKVSLRLSPEEIKEIAAEGEKLYTSFYPRPYIQTLYIDDVPYNRIPENIKEIVDRWRIDSSDIDLNECGDLSNPFLVVIQEGEDWKVRLCGLLHGYENEWKENGFLEQDKKEFAEYCWKNREGAFEFLIPAVFEIDEDGEIGYGSFGREAEKEMRELEVKTNWDCMVHRRKQKAILIPDLSNGSNNIALDK